MVYGAGLENRYGSNLIVGSNPTPSATPTDLYKGAAPGLTAKSCLGMGSGLSVSARAPVSVFPLGGPLRNLREDSYTAW